ncbi:hypothetical protein DRQ11_04445 [candidate division KSB1 bacterium]|nr:MAG: hypothetical protein DRQ11_04445 [candidate division KSB1 bacterium]
MGNGRKADPATPREGRSSTECKPLLGGTKGTDVNNIGEMTVPPEKAPANSVPAAAVIRGGRALSGITGRKGHVGGQVSRR